MREHWRTFSSPSFIISFNTTRLLKRLGSFAGKKWNAMLKISENMDWGRRDEKRWEEENGLWLNPGEDANQQKKKGRRTDKDTQICRSLVVETEAGRPEGTSLWLDNDTEKSKGTCLPLCCVNRLHSWARKGFRAEVPPTNAPVLSALKKQYCTVTMPWLTRAKAC